MTANRTKKALRQKKMQKRGNRLILPSKHYSRKRHNNQKGGSPGPEMGIISQLGGDLVSVLPAKALDHEQGTWKGKDVFRAKYYKSPGCVEDMCSLEDMFEEGSPEREGTEEEKKEALAQACLNSLGVGMIERQTYEDYASVMKTFDSLSEKGRFYVLESNLLTIRQYISSLFAESTSDVSDPEEGLELKTRMEASSSELKLKLADKKRDELMSLLKVLNPAYYQYIVKTTLLPVRVREEVAAAMTFARRLTNPVELLNLVLKYYNTPDPFYMDWHKQWLMRSKPEDYPPTTGFLGDYATFKFRIVKAVFCPHSAAVNRYKEGENWDFHGTIAPIELPMMGIQHPERFQKTIQETYMDSFTRHNLIKMAENQSAPALNVDKRFRDMTKYPGTDAGVEKYAAEMFVEVLSRILDMNTKDTRELIKNDLNVHPVFRKLYEDRKDDSEGEATRNLSKTPTPEESITALRETGKFNLISKVFGGVFGTSILYALQNNWDIGTIGDRDLDMTGNLDKNWLPNGEPLGMFAHMLTMQMNIRGTNLEENMDCRRFVLKNIHHESDERLRPTISVGAARSILGFLQKEAPYYLKQYPELFEKGGAPDAKLGDRLYGGVDGYREIDLEKKMARVVNVYETTLTLPDIEIEGTGKEGVYRICMITEVSEYKNIDNTDTPVERSTIFQVVWEDQSLANQNAFGEECVALDKMLMDNIWRSMNSKAIEAGNTLLPQAEPSQEEKQEEPAPESAPAPEPAVGEVPQPEEPKQEEMEEELGELEEVNIGETGDNEELEKVDLKIEDDGDKTDIDSDVESDTDIEETSPIPSMPPVPKPAPGKSALKVREEGYRIKPASRSRKLMRDFAPNRTRKVRIDTKRNLSEDLMLDDDGNPLRGVDRKPVSKNIADSVIALG